ncbi:MAG: amidohydrolase family protein [Deltaproteobacteria bacterium]|nr:amidohydrolase family protein [Deltaproteobacteria bacterium]
MATTHPSRSAAIRARLPHPIIDSDGHTAEFEPAFFDYLTKIAGGNAVERLKTAPDVPFSFLWYTLSPQERRHRRIPRPHWWVHPTKNTLDRATSSLPKLLRARLDETGLDFTIIYPSMGMALLHMGDEELRRAACRALNTYHADIFRECADRMTPVAVIPMHTPQEAIAELEYAVTKLGFKAILMAAQVRRPIPALASAPPEVNRYAFWLDTFGIDSAYDYDPVWAKCVELKVSPTFHSIGVGWGSRTSISNFMYNHIGHFAASAEAACKSLFFGGVTRRFPQVRFAFLEGGVGWACTLFGDLVGHWEKHNVKFVEHFNPANLDEQLLSDLFRQYGGGSLNAEKLANKADRSQLMWGNPNEDPADLDEWAACKIERKEDIRDLFVRSFYFGCEGDDRVTSWAFDTKKLPFGSRLNAIYSSDLGHWDLPDMRDAAAEAYEMVEKGLLTEENFRDFVFVNGVKHKTDVNPDFFKGTVVEAAVKKLLAESAR